MSNYVNETPVSASNYLNADTAHKRCDLRVECGDLIVEVVHPAAQCHCGGLERVTDLVCLGAGTQTGDLVHEP